MKKRLISLIVAGTLIIAMLSGIATDTFASEVGTQATTPAMVSENLRLAEVKMFESGILAQEILLEYNDQQLLKSVYERWFDEDGKISNETTYRYFYDSQENLIRREKEYSSFEFIFVDEYIYNQHGQLESSTTEDSGGWSRNTYEYDSNGLLIRTTEEIQIYTLVTDYTYNSEGILTGAELTYDEYGEISVHKRTYEYDSEKKLCRIVTVGPNSTETETYEYDGQGRQSKIVQEFSWGTTCSTYDYDYMPFLVYEYNSSDVYLELDTWSLYLGDAELHANEKGYLATAEVSKWNRVYEFYYEDNPAEDDSEENSIIVYSDYTNLSIRKGSAITLSAGIIAGGKPTDDISGITFQIEDTSILSVVTTDTKDSFRYVKLKGLAEGTTTVIFNDSNTGSVVKIPITVYDNNYLSYTLSNVPTQQIEKYATNFYNVNGLYIDSYEYAVSDDQSATVSFDVYNSNYSYGAVEVLDENGTLIDTVLIDKMDSSLTGIKEAVLDNLAYLVRDIFQGDLLTYRQESGFSKMTSVSVKVPKNGYIKICTDPDNSSIVGLVNYADLLLSLLEFSGEITGFGTKSEEFADKLTAKVINEKIFAELVGDRDKMAQKLWKNIGKEALITSDAMGSFVDTAINNLSEFGLLDVVLSTASDCGWNIGEKVFTDLSGPFGVALKAIFTIGKAENIIIQYHDVTHSAGLGSIIIQNQGGGIRSCQQIKVECEDGFADDTALNVFCVTLEADVLDIIEKYNPDIYGQIVNGVTYTYNISLMKDGSETQPNGEVTVYIPIPDELKALAYAGDWIDGVPVKVKIYRIEEDGTLTEMDVRIEDGCFVFTTNHFSLYTIVGYDSVDDTTPNQNENSLSIIAIIGIVAVVIVGAGAIVIIKRRKNESH